MRMTKLWMRVLRQEMPVADENSSEIPPGQHRPRGHGGYEVKTGNGFENKSGVSGSRFNALSNDDVITEAPTHSEAQIEPELSKPVEKAKQSVNSDKAKAKNARKPLKDIPNPQFGKFF